MIETDIRAESGDVITCCEAEDTELQVKVDEVECVDTSVDYFTSIDRRKLYIQRLNTVCCLQFTLQPQTT